MVKAGVRLCLAVLAAAGLSTNISGQAASASSPQIAPSLQFTDPAVQARLGVPYQAAIDNLLVTNTVPYGRGVKGRRYNQTGLLARTPATFVRAGGGYKQPWTRDASVNSWNAASLLEPAVARNTLFAVVKRVKRGKSGPAGKLGTLPGTLIVQQDNQWWDQTIWAIAAWNHYLVTGDRAFLALAYQTAVDTLAREKQLHYSGGGQGSSGRGLYEGPAFLNDGIAGYPAPPADATESRGSFVLVYPGADKIMVLSTNCIYVEAYRSAARMAEALGKPETGLNAQADALTKAIQKTFWLPGKGRFGYLLQADGVLDESQESAGMAFAMLFGVATPEQAASMVKVAEVAPRGIVDVAPSFPRYDAEHPGRHNEIVWPPIEAFWAQAVAASGNVQAFARETETLAGLARGSGGHFWEIYNAQTGVPDGGWQVGHQWDVQPDQTWSATGYLRMVYAGLFGMQFFEDGLRFSPTLPEGWGPVSLSGVHYRHAVLSVKLSGRGQGVRSFKLDGVVQTKPEIPTGIMGAHTVEIELGDGPGLQ